MMDYKICFHAEIWLTIPELSLLPLLICSTVNGCECAKKYRYEGVDRENLGIIGHVLFTETYFVTIIRTLSSRQF